MIMVMFWPKYFKEVVRNGNRYSYWTTLTKKRLETLDGEIVDPEITVKLEMRNVLKVHDAQT